MGSLFSAMGLVFAAELGDKTQLVALGFGARQRIGPVLVGMAIAQAVANLLAVVVGRFIGARLPQRATRIGSAALFAVFGVVLIVVNW